MEQDAWGQESLVGVSWDLLWLFAGVALIFILGHMIYMRLRASRTANSAETPHEAGSGD